MKKISRMIQGHQKGPAVVDIEFDESHNKFKKNLTDTDSLVNQMANFSKVLSWLPSLFFLLIDS